MKLRAKFLALLMLLSLLFMGYVHLHWLPSVKQQTINLISEEYRAHLKTATEGLVPLLLEGQLANVYESLDALLFNNPSWHSLVLHSVEGDQLYPLATEIALEHDPSHYQTIIAEVGFSGISTMGTLTLTLDIEETMAAVDELEFSLGVALLFLVSAFVIGVSLELEWLVRKPLGQMIRAAKLLTEQNYNSPLPTDQNDEIGALAQSFSDMRSALEHHHISLAEEIQIHRRRADVLNEARERSEYEANHDPLTGLLNRRAFEYRMEQSLEDLKSVQDSALLNTVCFIDLDHFKQVNDRCGHDAGDRLLIDVTRLMQREVRDEDLFARMGGDEFALLLYGCNAEAAKTICDTICQRVAEYSLRTEQGDLQVGASIGIREMSALTQGLKPLMKEADMACYEAKAQGRGRACVYNSELSRSSSPNLTGWG